MRVQKGSVTKWALFISIYIMVGPAFAQSVAKNISPANPSSTTHSSTMKAATNAADNAPGSWSGSFNVGRSQSLVDFQDGTRKDSNDFELKNTLQLTKNYSLEILGSYSQDLHDSTASDFSDTTLTASRHAIDLGKYLQLGESAIAILPTSKNSHVRDNLIAGARAGVSFSMNPAINPNLSLGLSLGAGQNFHAYDTDINGKVLTKYAFNQNISAGYSFGRVSLSGIFKHKNGWTYTGQLKEAFEHIEELGFDLNKHFSLALGHTNTGTMLASNAQDSNLELVNENSSIVYGSLSYLF